LKCSPEKRFGDSVKLANAKVLARIERARHEIIDDSSLPLATNGCRRSSATFFSLHNFVDSCSTYQSRQRAEQQQQLLGDDCFNNI
jgi:hypothetical protein